MLRVFAYGRQLFIIAEIRLLYQFPNESVIQPLCNMLETILCNNHWNSDNIER
jgi:hypothetical protein